MPQQGPQWKATKDEVQYGPSRGADRCGLCESFREPGDCTRVAGRIYRGGWCQLFRYTPLDTDPDARSKG